VLIVLPATWVVSRHASIPVKVISSWVIAIAVLAATLQLLPSLRATCRIIWSNPCDHRCFAFLLGMLLCATHRSSRRTTSAQRRILDQSGSLTPLTLQVVTDHSASAHPFQREGITRFQSHFSRG